MPKLYPKASVGAVLPSCPDALGPVADTSVLNAMSSGVVVLDLDLRFCFANPPAEQMLDASERHLIGRSIADVLPADSHVLALVRDVASRQHSLSDYNITLATRRGNAQLVDVHLSLLGDPVSNLVVVLHQCSVVRQLDQQLANRGAARSVSQLALMLAHEVKNPLSGIRGAAQLLEGVLEADDRQLVQLICDETDRVVSLVEDMEQFTNDRPIRREPVNVHRVLDHVCRLGENGFGRHLKISAHYDPSLPAVSGDRDRLVQVFLNLLKNACESAPQSGGDIRVVTHYSHGLRVGARNSRDRLELPITVEIWDNGSGVPDDIGQHLFEPFVSSKPRGKGLGLPLVAKVVNDHGGVVGFQNAKRGTVFRVSLPAHAAPAADSS